MFKNSCDIPLYFVCLLFRVIHIDHHHYHVAIGTILWPQLRTNTSTCAWNGGCVCVCVCCWRTSTWCMHTQHTHTHTHIGARTLTQRTRTHLIYFCTAFNRSNNAAQEACCFTYCVFSLWLSRILDAQTASQWLKQKQIPRTYFGFEST